MADIKINVQVVEGQAKAALAGLERQTKEADKAFSSLNLSIKQVSSATSVFLGNIAAQAFSAAISGVKQFAGAIFDTAVEVDNIKRKLETLTGSAATAGKAFETIAKFSDESPFELAQVAEASEKLLALGVAVRDLEPALRTLGDISTASGANLSELALAFGKVQQQGVATGREISAFQNNAIPILDALAEVTGKTNGAVKKLANEGKIDAETFQKALKALGQEGGFAFNAMIKQSQTLDGRIKSLEDAFEEIRINIGEKLGPAFKAVIIAITQLVKGFGTFINATNTIRTAGQFVVDAFVAIVQGATFVYNSIQGLRFVLFTLGSGFASLAGTAIGAIEKILSGVKSLAAIGGIEIPGIDKAISGLNELKEVANGTGKDLAQSAIDIGTQMAFASQQADKFATDVQIAFNKEIVLAEESATATEESTRRKTVAKQGLTEAEIEAQKKKLQEQADLNATELEIQAAQDAALYQQRLVADGELSLQDQTNLEIYRTNKEQEVLINQIAEYQKIDDKKKVLELERKLEESRLKSQTEFYKQKQAIDLQNQQKTVNLIQAYGELGSAIAKDGSKEQFLISKASALAGAIVAGQLAYMQALSTPPGPPYTFGLASTVAKIASLNVATIAATAIKGFEDGGVVGGTSFTGDKVMARVNSGEMILNRQQQANLFSLANSASGSQSGDNVIHVSVELDGEVVARSVSRQVANGLKLGEVV